MNVEGKGLSRGRLGAEVEAFFVLITDRRGPGDQRTEPHTGYCEPHYD